MQLSHSLPRRTCATRHYSDYYLPPLERSHLIRTPPPRPSGRKLRAAPDEASTFPTFIFSFFFTYPGPFGFFALRSESKFRLARTVQLEPLVLWSGTFGHPQRLLGGSLLFAIVGCPTVHGLGLLVCTRYASPLNFLVSFLSLGHTPIVFLSRCINSP